MRFDSRATEQPTQTEIETIDGRRVAVKLVVNPRARHVSVRIDPTRREAIATAPSKRHLKHAAQFAADRAGWIVHELARLPQGVLLRQARVRRCAGCCTNWFTSMDARRRASKPGDAAASGRAGAGPGIVRVAPVALLQGASAR